MSDYSNIAAFTLAFVFGLPLILQTIKDSQHIGIVLDPDKIFSPTSHWAQQAITELTVFEAGILIVLCVWFVVWVTS